MVSSDPFIYHNPSIFGPENNRITLNRCHFTVGSVEEPDAARGEDVARPANG